jgi:hypothetical protein
MFFENLKITKLSGQARDFFIYLFYRDYAKIYGPPKILQKYTSGAMAHGVRDITPWAVALGAARSGP